MARIGGAFPLPLAQVQEGGASIELASGGVFYPPSGEYLLTLGTGCVAQYWDPVAQQWRTFCPAGSGCFVSFDGYNFRLLNTTGIVSSMAITGAGTGGTNGIGFAATGAAAAIAASDTTGGAGATAYVIVGGSVAAPTITQAGSGFVVPPLVVIDPPPAGGIQATAIAALTAGGGIASITMENVGAGYTASPNFWLLPQTGVYQGGTSGGNTQGAIPAPGLVYPSNAAPGNQNTSSSGAQLTSIALTGSGTVTGLVIVNSGGGYTSASPTVTVTGLSGSPTATATVATTTPAVSISFLQPRVQ